MFAQVLERGRYTLLTLEEGWHSLNNNESCKDYPTNSK